jgi:hypothetical protein
MHICNLCHLTTSLSASWGGRQAKPAQKYTMLPTYSASQFTYIAMCKSALIASNNLAAVQLTICLGCCVLIVYSLFPMPLIPTETHCSIALVWRMEKDGIMGGRSNELNGVSKSLRVNLDLYGSLWKRKKSYMGESMKRSRWYDWVVCVLLRSFLWIDAGCMIKPHEF